MKRNEMIELIRKKATFLKQLDEKTHVQTYSGMIYNGKIKRIEDLYLVINDRKIGEKKLIFDEIKLIDEYKEFA